MFPFRGTERRTFQMLHGASGFPPSSAEGVRGAVMSRDVLLHPASTTGPVSIEPSTVGPRLSHGARRDPAVLVGTSDKSFLVNPSRIGDKSHRHGTGANGCPIG